MIAGIDHMADLLGGGAFSLLGDGEAVAVAQHHDSGSQGTAASGEAGAQIEVHITLLYQSGGDHIGIHQGLHLAGEGLVNDLLCLGRGQAAALDFKQE